MMNEAIFVIAGSAFGVMVTQGVAFMSNRNAAAIENKKVAIAEKDADAKVETHDDDHYLKASDATWKRVVKMQDMQETRINEMEARGIKNDKLRKEMETKIEDLEVGKVADGKRIATLEQTVEDLEVGKIADGKRIATLEQTVERLEKSLSDERKQHSATKKRELKLQERVRALESGKPPSMF